MHFIQNIVECLFLIVVLLFSLWHCDPFSLSSRFADYYGVANLGYDRGAYVVKEVNGRLADAREGAMMAVNLELRILAAAVALRRRLYFDVSSLISGPRNESSRPFEYDNRTSITQFLLDIFNTTITKTSGLLYHNISVRTKQIKLDSNGVGRKKGSATDERGQADDQAITPVEDSGRNDIANRDVEDGSLGVDLEELRDRVREAYQSVRLRSGHHMPYYADKNDPKRVLQLSPFQTEKLIEQAVFATNSADKLPYQLRNYNSFREAKVDFSVLRWHGPRIDHARLHQQTLHRLRAQAAAFLQNNPEAEVNYQHAIAQSSLPLPETPARGPYQNLVIGMCTVGRPSGGNYLAATLRSLLRESIAPEEAEGIRLVLYNAHNPPEQHPEISQVRNEFSAEILARRLIIISRPPPPRFPDQSWSNAVNEVRSSYDVVYKRTAPLYDRIERVRAMLDEKGDLGIEDYERYWIDEGGRAAADAAPQPTAEPPAPISPTIPIERRWGDSIKRVLWRSKQALDVAYLMDYVGAAARWTDTKARHADEDDPYLPALSLKGHHFFLMTEDDIRASRHWPTKIRFWIDTKLRGRNDWTFATFYNPWSDVKKDGEKLPPYKFFGVIGQLSRLHELPLMAEFLRLNYDQSPLDWLFVDYMKRINGHTKKHSAGNDEDGMLVHVPSLFQHIGKVSSLAGKAQPGEAVDFEE